MTNPPCPFGCGHLELEHHVYKAHVDSKRNEREGWFWVCHRCNHHWPRHSALYRVTARPGAEPDKIKPRRILD